MKKMFLLMAALVAIGSVISGCASISTFPVGKYVLPADRVQLGSGKISGTWSGNDLSVNYTYSQAGQGADLSGMIRFADHMTINFSYLREFHLAILFLDNDGKVLGTSGLATNRGSLVDMPFRVRISPPGGTASITFGYQGTAIGSGSEQGGGDFYSFWQYPVR